MCRAKKNITITTTTTTTRTPFNTQRRSTGSNRKFSDTFALGARQTIGLQLLFSKRNRFYTHITNTSIWAHVYCSVLLA